MHDESFVLGYYACLILTISRYIRKQLAGIPLYSEMSVYIYDKNNGSSVESHSDHSVNDKYCIQRKLLITNWAQTHISCLSKPKDKKLIVFQITSLNTFGGCISFIFFTLCLYVNLVSLPFTHLLP